MSKTWNVKPLPLKRRTPVPSDMEIVRDHEPKRITQLAQEMGLKESEILPFGHFVAKVEVKDRPLVPPEERGKYIVVTGINPTPLGEGKSTLAIGLSQCLDAWLHRPTIACLRQASQGPTFGIKGGAAGGGYSQVLPMTDFNLHLTGDIHAVTAANNLLAAAIDARAFHEATQKDDALFNRLVPPNIGFTESQRLRLEKLGIQKSDPKDLTPDERRSFARLNLDMNGLNWNRVLDVNDRFLRKVTIGQSSTEKGMQRETQFDISVASELMAVMALCSDVGDARRRIGRIVVGYSNDSTPRPVTCDDLCITGALTVLLKDALKPNLMQTLEGTPVLVHAGPFANIAHGNSSVIADRLALSLVGPNGFVVTEAGFGADVGLEKFVDIKARASGLFPDACVLVCTVRALKTHGGGPAVTPGAALAKEYRTEDLDLLSKGMQNLVHHIRTAKQEFGLRVVVAINRFTTDTEAELQMVRKESLANGADGAEICDNWTTGGEGVVDLARALITACEKPVTSVCRPLFPLTLSIKDKIATIVRRVYGGDGSVVYSDLADEKIERFSSLGFGEMGICIAKTQYSLTADPRVKGVSRGFKDFPVQDIRVSAGAGFLVAIAGDMQTMPGLPTRPAFFDIDIHPETGDVTGLF